MLGLLATSQTACSEASEQAGAGANVHGSGGGRDEGDEVAEGTGAGAGAVGDDSAGVGGVTMEGTAGGESAGEGGSSGEVVGVISTKTVPDLSMEAFTRMCDEVHGVVEVHAHCGGFVTGPGFSYDSGTDAFTEHTCAGYNTCAGFSCVVDDPDA